jgi:hypothetical protein
LISSRISDPSRCAARTTALVDQMVFEGIRCAEEIVQLNMFGARQPGVILAFDDNVLQCNIAQARVRL